MSKKNRLFRELSPNNYSKVAHFYIYIIFM